MVGFHCPQAGISYPGQTLIIQLQLREERSYNLLYGKEEKKSLVYYAFSFVCIKNIYIGGHGCVWF